MLSSFHRESTMTPGPDQFIRCPYCSGLGRFATIRSGNSIGATVYTDGKRVAPMMPESPAVVSCYRCNGIYLLDDATHVASIELDPEWLAAKLVREPTEREYLVALKGEFMKGLSPEKSMRIFAWWRGNDAYRNGRRKASVEQEDLLTLRSANLWALVALLSSHDPGERLMKAEVLRHLGEFDLALDELNIGDPSTAEAALFITELCKKRDHRLRVLFRSAPSRRSSARSVGHAR
jgi:hypothetical protein